MHGHFDDVIAQLDALLQEPEIKVLVERKQGTHIFLCYSRQNLAPALQTHNALELFDWTPLVSPRSAIPKSPYEE
jgi:hypothetical protein